MCRFLTGKARLQQTDKRRIWKLLDNEIYKANDGKIYIVPRNMQTDSYTIPCWIAWLAGSPVDHDTRASHLHDELCYGHEAIVVNLTEKELRDKGYLRFLEKHNMWICEDIPAEYLSKEKVSKVKTDNLLYECMKAAYVPRINRIIIRGGVFFNIGWLIDFWTGKVFEFELEKIYEEEYWDKHVRAK